MDMSGWFSDTITIGSVSAVNDYGEKTYGSNVEVKARVESVRNLVTGPDGNEVQADYKIATATDIPEIETIFVDIVDPRLNILGCKGLGEPPRIPTSAAVANAVYNAIGVHIREIPMTPDKVLKALKRKGVA